jgi:hypothetical protein
MRWFIAGFLALTGLLLTTAARADDVFDRTGRAIGRTAQDAGRALEQGFHQIGDAVEQGARQAGQAIGQGTEQAGAAIQRGGRDMSRASKPVLAEPAYRDTTYPY